MITVSKSDFEMSVIPDNDFDTSYLEQDGFEDRRAMFQRGEFEFVGVRAEIQLQIPYGHDFIIKTIESPGLWGVESDSGEAYLREVFQEECEVLADILAELGVTVVE